MKKVNMRKPQNTSRFSKLFPDMHRTEGSTSMRQMAHNVGSMPVWGRTTGPLQCHILGRGGIVLIKCHR